MIARSLAGDLREQRESEWQALRFPVWADFGDNAPLRNCVMSNVSVECATLAIKTPGDVPDSFTLVLSRDGSIRWSCRVIWRSNLEVGIEFH